MTSFVARYVILWSRFDHCETGWLGNWCILVGIRYRLSYLFYTPMVTVSSCTCACTSVTNCTGDFILGFYFFFSFFLFFFSYIFYWEEKRKNFILWSSYVYVCVLVINYTGNFMSYFLFSVSLNFILWEQKINSVVVIEWALCSKLQYIFYCNKFKD